jgi:pimeloyl-ACP methyl ester carboxylesterase
VFFTTSDGVRLYYELWGDSDLPVVIDPGWIGSVELYAELYRPLVRQGLSVLAYERRGQGRSDRPDPGSTDYSPNQLARDSSELAAHVGIERRVALGLFDGARIALRNLAARPEETEALIVAAPTIFTPTSSAAYQAFRDLLRQSDFATMLRQLLVMSSPGWSEEERAPWVEVLRANSTNEIGRAIWDATVEADDRALLDEISCPVLVISGRQQIVPDPERTADVLRRLPAARLVELEGTATMPRPGVDDPTGVIAEFLRESGVLPA